MQLTSITIQYFRSFVAPQTIPVEEDVTVFVGKNESGKTTILKALHRLNPANDDGDTKFDLTIEYPRWRLAPDRRRNPNLDELQPIKAEFMIGRPDSEALAEVLPAAPPVGAVVTATRRYNGNQTIDIRANLALVVDAAVAAADVASQDAAALREENALDGAIARARARSKELKDEPDASLRSKALTQFASVASKYKYLQGAEEVDQDGRNALWARLPRFFYFSTYQHLPGECDLTALAAKIAGNASLTGSEQTIVALLAHAGEKPSDFLDDHYDSRKAELQAASVDLSRNVFKYWRQNKDLAVVFDTDNVSIEQHPQGGDIMHRFLKIELRDGRHGDVETNFETRSAGFRWFFSFFAAFSEYQDSDDPLVVLLDEPGTSLHGDAQQDFVQFVSEELAPAKQTVYTTHSQYMIDPAKYEKLRAVHDRATREDPDLAVVVTSVDLSADRETVLPLESALGTSVSQHLFIGAGPHLAVEGGSDFVYLQRLTEYLLSHGSEEGLDPRLAVIPVGGADNLPAFVALMGRRLKVSVLVDGARSSKTLGRIQAAAQANNVSLDSIVLCADADPALPRTADIEDLFAVDDYLRLYNWAFDKNVRASALADTAEPTIKRLIDIEGEFDHAIPAHALTYRRAEFFGSVDPVTVERFKKLFALLNATVANE